MTTKTCGCRRFVYKTTEAEHVPKTPCQACGHRRNDHEDYLDKPVPCTATHTALDAMKEAVNVTK